MKDIAVAPAKNPISPKLSSGFNLEPVARPLTHVASAFVQLQKVHHDADRNRACRFTRREALDFADLTAQALQDGQQFRGTVHADTFLTGFLAFRYV